MIQDYKLLREVNIRIVHELQQDLPIPVLPVLTYTFGKHVPWQLDLLAVISLRQDVPVY